MNLYFFSFNVKKKTSKVKIFRDFVKLKGICIPQIRKCNWNNFCTKSVKILNNLHIANRMKRMVIDGYKANKLIA